MIWNRYVVVSAKHLSTSACSVVDSTKELGGKSIRAYFAEKMTVVPPATMDTALSDQLQQLSETVVALSKKVDRLTLSQNRNDQIAHVPSWPKLGIKRRRGDTGQSVRESADRGTKTIDFSDLSVTSITAAAPPARWWLYLSGFLPTISDTDVNKVVHRCLNLDDHDTIDVARLIPKGTDVSKLTFISFKIGLDPQLKQLALLASSWPTGLLFREFIDMSKNRYGGTTVLDTNPSDVA